LVARPSSRWRQAQQDQPPPIVCVLTGNVATDPGAQMRVQAFREGLADLGWIENQNFRLEVRWPGPNLARQ
jgi:putative ABC transport system substrate-binding protein